MMPENPLEISPDNHSKRYSNLLEISGGRLFNKGTEIPVELVSDVKIRNSGSSFGIFLCCFLSAFFLVGSYSFFQRSMFGAFAVSLVLSAFSLYGSFLASHAGKSKEVWIKVGNIPVKIYTSATFGEADKVKIEIEDFIKLKKSADD